jgi:FimV-like protein
VPPSADSGVDSASASGFEEAADAAEGDVAAQALREDLSRAEEALITQQQQNEYLEERIRELESQLARRDEGSVADEDLANTENRLREQRQAAAQEPREQARPWYARIGVWLIGLLVAAAALVGWLFSRRAAAHGAAVAGPAESLRDIKHEAEDVLRVLADDRAQKPAAGATAGPPEPPADQPAPRAGAVEDAELLDEDSSDPEIQLDLARAYISMGDREAARVILQEVVNNGSEAQQAEARKMLGFL